MRLYEVAFEVAGPMAMFMRPDTGSTPVSYPVPTWSALKGIFEAVGRVKHAYVRPTRVEVCRPVRFDRYTTNYGGPLRKPGQISAGDDYQLRAVVLVDVCYKVYGVCEQFELAPGGVNAAHALREVLARRMASGQTLYTPCLGWKEFAPSFFGPLRAETHRDTRVTLTIPSLLHSVFDRPKFGRVSPFFNQDVRVEEGLLQFGERPPP